jgi:hypothetical protein
MARCRAARQPILAENFLTIRSLLSSTHVSSVHSCVQPETEKPMLLACRLPIYRTRLTAHAIQVGGRHLDVPTTRWTAERHAWPLFTRYHGSAKPTSNWVSVRDSIFFSRSPKRLKAAAVIIGPEQDSALCDWLLRNDGGGYRLSKLDSWPSARNQKPMRQSFPAVPIPS